MFFKRFYDDGLAQASYLIGCESSGEAVVVDPNRDVDQYVAAAAADKLRITHVTETHIHADFVSGSRELADRTGAKLLLSAEGGRDWQYAFAAQSHAVLLSDGNSFTVGRVRLDVIHTPGHTPEHLAFLVTDFASSSKPIGILSGDFVFVGDVGRPDLLERAAKKVGTMEAAAHELFRSIQRFRDLPDYLQLWPGHGAGSACGKSLGAMPQSTVGYEKFANWALVSRDETAFVTEVLAGQPEPPAYFAEMKRINRDGPALLGKISTAPQVSAKTLMKILGDPKSGNVFDARNADAFAAGHVPGTINIPFGKSFSTWAGSLLPFDRDLFFIVASQEAASAVSRELAMIGLDRIAGWCSAESVAPETSEQVRQIDTAKLAAQMALGDVVVVDVRSRTEWEHGHLPGALHVPLGQLLARITEIPAGHPVVVQCQGGARSAIGSSILLSQGRSEVINLRGGYAEWVREGHVVTSSPSNRPE
jgi:hydroxyacylglutathione hydrolase